MPCATLVAGKSHSVFCPAFCQWPLCCWWLAQTHTCGWQHNDCNFVGRLPARNCGQSGSHGPGRACANTAASWLTPANWIAAMACAAPARSRSCTGRGRQHGSAAAAAVLLSCVCSRADWLAPGQLAAGRLAGWPAGRLAGWPAGRLAGWLHLAAGSLAVRQTRRCGCRPAGWATG
jgi:hypothetical protein